MDVVITYVDPMEEEWRVSYDLVVGGTMGKNHFSDFGTLKYVLRGIDKHMPYVKNVFLVVSSENQVPEYVNKDAVKIITHKEIIPPTFLPTFNALAIECFLWNIPELDNEFIYFNDDMVPISDIKKDEFFDDGTPCITFITEDLQGNEFNSIVNKSSETAAFFCETESIKNLRPIHSATPYKKIFYEAFYKKGQEALDASIKPIRYNGSIGQYYFADCLYYRGLTKEKSPSLFYFTTKEDLNEIESSILEQRPQIICVNDGHYYSVESNEDVHTHINSLLNNLLPNKSRYEL